MRAAKKGNGVLVIFILSAIFFALCLCLGMIAGYQLDDELLTDLTQYVKSAFEEKTGFKKVLANAVKSDFRYTLTVLISSLSVISSFFPLVLIGVKGFSSGLATSVASSALGGFSEIFVFSSAVLLACIFTVPAYVFLFVMCFKFADENRKNRESFGAKSKGYMKFFAAVMIVFALLCVADCFVAALYELLFAVVQ